MANKTQQIKIESIFGGMASYSRFADADQFLNSFSIEPDTSVDGTFGSSGILSPNIVDILGTTTAVPAWIITNPKNDLVYVYDVAGSVYSYNGTSLTGLGDLNDGGTASGNGAAYYDNYIYFARDTTIARYGPLDGTPTFTDDYWVGVLGMAALSDTTYPTLSIEMPNHVMQRHSDGALYFTDVVGNQGVVHKIQTSKTTVEGDTNNGSTFNAVDFGHGLWPTALESYGTDLAVALFEGVASPSSANVRSTRARLAFWDPTNTITYDQITNEEFPDPLLTALMNSNGVLYAFSGEKAGFTRVTRFSGGYTQEEVASIEFVQPPLASAVDGVLNKVYFAGNNNRQLRPNVYSIGLKKSQISKALFSSIGIPTSVSAGAHIPALKVGLNGGGTLKPLIGVANVSTYSLQTPVTTGSTQTNVASFMSAPLRVGQPFKVTKVSFFVVQPASGFPSDMSINVGLMLDSYSGSPTNIHTITSSNVPTNRRVSIRPTNMTGAHDFVLAFDWSSTESVSISLPITIEIELYDD